MPSLSNSGQALTTQTRALQHSSATLEHTEMSDRKRKEDAASWLHRRECFLIFKKVVEAEKAQGGLQILDVLARVNRMSKLNPCQQLPKETMVNMCLPLNKGILANPDNRKMWEASEEKGQEIPSLTLLLT